MPDRPLFLERASFRRRRLGDAARVLPVLAALAVLVPVWWLPRGVSFGAGAVWLFGLWAVLILAIFLLHRALIRSEAATQSAGVDALPPQHADREGPDAL